MSDVLAVDIGGTKLAVGVVDGDGNLSLRRQIQTPSTDDGEVLFAAVVGLIDELEVGPEAVGIGVGVGGPMTADGEAVSPLNISVWRSFPLRSRLIDRYGLEVFIDNDAKALALGEGWRGAAVGVDNYIAMVVSTGVGGGIVLDGRLLQGASGNVGHIGHVVVEPAGHELAGHVRGVLESEASGTAIADITGRPAAEAEAAMVRRTGVMVGRAVASVANLLDLRLAVVAGSVALGFGPPFFAAAEGEIDRVAQLDFSVGTRIVPAGLGDEGPLIGAGAVGWTGLGHAVLARS